MSQINLNVVSGRQRDVVGTINAFEGLQTSVGRIASVTNRTVRFDDGSYRRNLEDVTVRLSDARRYGYINELGFQVRAESGRRATTAANW